jgi:cardiolipin synthase
MQSIPRSVLRFCRRFVKRQYLRHTEWWLALVILCGCTVAPRVDRLPEIQLGEPAFFPTIEAYTDAPIVGGNRVQLLFNGDQTFPAMLREIRGAKSTITFAQYLYENGAIAYEIAEAFSERCRAGVQVHILIDSQGSGKIPDDIPARMRDAGCHLEFFRRIEAPQVFVPWKLLRYNYRNHRRVLVIDGRVGFTGGYGISDTWTGNGRREGHWRETNVRVEGPVVKYLQAGFTESWFEATGTLLGGEDYFPRLEPVGAVHAQMVKSSPLSGSFQNYMLLLLSISSAKKSILITNSYFIPDDTMIDALVDAASRGVRVVVLVPGKIDHQITYRASRANYGRLLLEGVHIFEYMAALMHAKTMVVDGVWGTVGSTNFDNRSFALNEELNLTFYDSGLAGQLEKAFEEDLKYAKEITHEAWSSRGMGERIYEFVAFPVKELL